MTREQVESCRTRETGRESKESCRLLRHGLLVVALVCPGAFASDVPSVSFEPYEFVTGSGISIRAELGRLAVPEDRSVSHGETIELAFLRLTSTAAAPGSPIVYLAGGPGGSGIELARGPRFPLFAALRELGDVIALDQRGTGLSRPDLSCPEPPALDPSRDSAPNELLARGRGAAGECASYFRDRGVDLAAYNTAASADDLDDLRRALGAERLRLIGMSYGTHLGLAAIRRHPNTIERAVLAGVEGPDHTLKLPSDLDAQLYLVSRRLAADPSWGESLPDLASLVSGLASRLDRAPISVTLPPMPAVSGEPQRVLLNGFSVRLLAAEMIGRRRTISSLPALFSPTMGDDFVPLAQVLRSELSASSLSAMGLAMDCASGASPARRARVESEAVRTILGRALDFPFPEVCSAIGVPDLGGEFRTPIESDVPVLFVSGALDGRTPPSNAEEVLQGFANGSHLIVGEVGHDDGLLVGSPELLAAIAGFLGGAPPTTGRLSLPPLDFFPPSAVTLADFLPGDASATGSLLIEGVTLIDGTGAPARAGWSVLVTDGAIAKVGPADTIEAPSDARHLDGTGRFLIPGLWDMHVHLSKIGPTALPLFVANGVTGVRDMGSDFSEVAVWRTEIEQGLRVGPRIRTSGPMLESASNVQRMLDGGVVEPVATTRTSIADASEATAAVESLATRGVDFVKVRTFASADALVAIATAAHAAELPLVGHTAGLPPELILDLGFSSVEHFLYPTLDDRSPEERRAVFDRFAQKGVAFVPTMVNWLESLSLPAERVSAVVFDDTARLDPRRAYVSEHLLADWREQAAERHMPSPIDFAPIVESTRRNLIEMREAGVRILPGTDAAVVLIYPGFSLHEELAHLVEIGGLSPLEALVAATRSSAEQLGLAETQGTIEPGKLADLVLLDADPLVDIRNTQRIVGVVTAGRYYDAAGVRQLLQGVAAAVRRPL